MDQFSRLFEPGKIGKLEIKNRLVMAAMGTRAADGEGYITQRSIDYYVARARGGVGLIITESTDPVRENRLPKSNWIFDDCFVPKLRELSEAVHDNGVRIVVQLIHRGVQPYRAAELKVFNRPAIIDICGPSSMPYGAGVIPREMSKPDIKDVINQLSEGARRAKDAGFDGVEFHGAHGYLLSCFFSPLFNRRTDEYGGNVKNRTRIGYELIERTREKVGADFVIMMKINGCDYLEGGVEIDEAVERAQILEEAGIDALDISASMIGSTEWQLLSYMYPSGAITHLAAAVKRAVKVPVIAVGKIGDPFTAESILEQDKADFVALGRALIADPEWPNKTREGRVDEIRQCIYCNNCLQRTRIESPVDRIITRCTVNPEALREREMVIKPAPIPKNVLVAGGGLAGMEVSRVLAERGHRVELYEKTEFLGGQWAVASKLDDKKDLFSSLTERLSKAINEARIQIYLRTTVTPDLIKKNKPDAVVIATGATPKVIDVPGVYGENVVQANNVINGTAQVGSEVVVVGGRLVGMEVADLLAKQKKKVSIVTLKALGQNGAAIDDNLFRTLRRRLIDAGVFVYAYSPVREILRTGIYVVNAGQLLFLKADTIVFAVGVEADTTLFYQLHGLVPELYRIGDCVEPRDACEAMSEAAEVGRRI